MSMVILSIGRKIPYRIQNFDVRRWDGWVHRIGGGGPLDIRSDIRHPT